MEDGKRYECPRCGKDFDDAEKLKKHTRLEHETGERKEGSAGDEGRIAGVRNRGGVAGRMGGGTENLGSKDAEDDGEYDGEDEDDEDGDDEDWDDEEDDGA